MKPGLPFLYRIVNHIMQYRDPDFSVKLTALPEAWCKREKIYPITIPHKTRCPAGRVLLENKTYFIKMRVINSSR